jgi:protein TonB
MRFACRELVVVVALLFVPASIHAQRVFSSGDDGVVLPVVVTRVNPDYTPEAKAAGIQGSVVLDVVVLVDGSVGDVSVTRSLDSGLDRESVAAAKQWRFTPGTKDGERVAVRVQLEMSFTLK